MTGIPSAPCGVPQIEVLFKIDINGILNITAVDKSSGSQEKLNVTNDMDHLSKEDIERMVSEAEKYKDEDEKQRDRISAKNSLELYCYNMLSTAEDEKVKLEDEEYQKIQDKCQEAISWLDANQTAETEEYKDKLKEVEAVCTKMDQQSGGGAGTGSGSTVEEVD